MEILAFDEYNATGHLIWSENYPGAYVRGAARDAALAKFPEEMRLYLRWAECAASIEKCTVRIVAEKASTLHIEDADSDALFEGERAPLTHGEYARLKSLALKSAEDFLRLYRSIPDKTGTVLQRRNTFYGDVPVTADEMYLHTKDVNHYYFDEIHIDIGNEPDILACREAGFALLEHTGDHLANPVFNGSYGEQWSLRKVLRRFLWHDRIHAKAMYKMASALCGATNIADPFLFGERRQNITSI